MKLFGRRRKEGDPPAAARSGGPAAPALPVPSGIRLAEHLSDLWQEINAIAREDGLQDRTAVEHYNLTSEGKKDVERWLNIYLRRIRPGAVYRLPPHYPRHRGFCLIPRLWPEGLRWQAVDEETLFRAKVGEQADRSKLIEELDRYLDARAGS